MRGSQPKARPFQVMMVKIHTERELARQTGEATALPGGARPANFSKPQEAGFHLLPIATDISSLLRKQ